MHAKYSIQFLVALHAYPVSRRVSTVSVDNADRVIIAMLVIEARVFAARNLATYAWVTNAHAAARANVIVRPRVKVIVLSRVKVITLSRTEGS